MKSKQLKPRIRRKETIKIKVEINETKTLKRQSSRQMKRAVGSLKKIKLTNSYLGDPGKRRPTRIGKVEERSGVTMSTVDTEGPMA